jgi:hypothetical protein
MSTSDWLSLLAIVLSFWAIYLGRRSEIRSKRIEGAQKIGQLQLSLMNTHLKLESQLERYREVLSRANPNSDEAATLRRIISKASALVVDIESQSKRLFGATVIDEVAFEEALSLARMAERNAEHIESLPLRTSNA